MHVAGGSHSLNMLNGVILDIQVEVGIVNQILIRLSIHTGGEELAAIATLDGDVTSRPYSGTGSVCIGVCVFHRSASRCTGAHSGESDSGKCSSGNRT